MKALRFIGNRPVCDYRAHGNQHLADYRVEDAVGRVATVCSDHLLQFTRPETLAELKSALELADLEAATGAADSR